LTNSLDSSLKIVDIKTGTAVHTFRNAEFSTSQGWSRSVFSPDGRYVASGSNSNGTIMVWDASDGQLKAKLSGAHIAGVVGIDWCRGGSGGQQVATIDRKGVLVLWA
jgi:autophagy-related protein 16-1